MRLFIRFIPAVFLLAKISAHAQAAADSTDEGDTMYTVDSLPGTDQKEVDFQESVDRLFVPDSAAIDTSGWSEDKINVSPFDYRRMSDTARVVLRDSLKKRIFVFPLDADSISISSPFGLRKSFWHYGMDIRLHRRDTVRCAFDGMVRVIQNDRHGYGKVVVVRHPGQIETLYGHLSKTLVTCGLRVKAGDAVGLGGSTGRSTGPHLHFELRYRGEPFDPNCIVDFENGALKADTLVLTKDNFAYLAEAHSTVTCVVCRGETLGSIARRHGTTVSKLCALNGIKPRTVLRVGRKIIIRKNPLPDSLTALVSVIAAADSTGKEHVPSDSTKSTPKQ